MVALGASGIASVQRGRRYDKGSYVSSADSDHDDNQSPAPKFLDDGESYPIVPIANRERNYDNR